MQLSYSAESKISTSKQHLKPPVLLILHVHMPCKNAKWSDYLKTVLGYPSDAEDQRADNGWCRGIDSFQINLEVISLHKEHMDWNSSLLNVQYISSCALNYTSEIWFYWF